MLHFQIDAHSGIPVYRQIMDQVKYYTASGVLEKGAALPSIRQMARELSVNPTTIVKAYTELQHEGVIEMRHGKGAFIAEGSKTISREEQKKALGRPARQLIIEATQMGADAETVMEVVKEQLQKLISDNETHDDHDNARSTKQ